MADRIAAPRNGPAAMPRKVSAPMTPRARGRAVAVVQVGRRRRADRHEDPAADGLDEPRGDELIEVLRGAGQRRADREDAERGR